MSLLNDSKPTVSDLVAEAYNHLWEWALKEDQRTYEQFGLGVVGIGALFFAYGLVQVHDVQILIALVGLAGSGVLWSQMYGTRQEFYSAMDLLCRHNPIFKTLFSNRKLDKWRSESWVHLWLWQPSNRLMLYFMSSVAGAWLSVILSLFGVPLIPWIVILDAEIATATLIMLILRKLQDLGRLARFGILPRTFGGSSQSKICEYCHQS